MLVQNDIERAVITRNSSTGTQVFMEKLSQEVANNKHMYPLLDPNNIFSEVYYNDDPLQPHVYIHHRILQG